MPVQRCRPLKFLARGFQEEKCAVIHRTSNQDIVLITDFVCMVCIII